jgi:hypothetical protein
LGEELQGIKPKPWLREEEQSSSIALFSTRSQPRKQRRVIPLCRSQNNLCNPIPVLVTILSYKDFFVRDAKMLVTWLGIAMFLFSALTVPSQLIELRIACMTSNQGQLLSLLGMVPLV